MIALNHHIRREVLPMLSMHLLIDIDMSGGGHVPECYGAHPALEWVGRWIPTIARHLRYIQLFNYQHFRNQPPLRHPFHCMSSILIYLRKMERPVTYRIASDCSVCSHTHEIDIDGIKHVVSHIEQLDVWKLLKQADMSRNVYAAAWDPERYDELTLELLGHTLM